MTELLVEEFSKVGLELNASKSKILTNETVDFEYIDIAGDMVEIVQDLKTHRYLGRFLSGNLDARGLIEVRHRIQCAWMKFGQNARTVTNRKVSLKLRLRLFDAVVSPSLLFGLVALPISEDNLNRIDAC